MNALRDMLKRHEGCPRLPNGNAKLYQDSVGKWTIGWGWNLCDNGLPLPVAEQLLDLAITEARNTLFSAFPVFRTLDGVRQDALTNLVFNMGITSFSGFKNTIRALETGDYAGAVDRLKQSKWYQQVQKERSDDIFTMLLTGTYPS